MSLVTLAETASRSWARLETQTCANSITAEWKLVNEAFNRTLDNSFSGTSLHLGFTGYEVQYPFGDDSSHFVEAQSVDAVISVHDSGQWVADIGPFKTLENIHAADLQRNKCSSMLTSQEAPCSLVSIDSWEGLLEAPYETTIIRAHCTWQVRLALAAVSLSLGHPAIVFGNHGCWDCACEVLKAMYQEYRETQFTKKPEEAV